MPETSVLLVGEAWQALQFDMKGFDFYSRSTYNESIEPLQSALEANGVDTDYIPTTRAGSEFPTSAEELEKYDVILLSDIGYNTLAIPPATFDDFEQIPNRLFLLDDYVRNGGGLIMVGGYLSFQGYHGKAGYKDTPIEDILPVSLKTFDDRVERSDGVTPVVTDHTHSIVKDAPAEWPALLGYNRVFPDDDATQLVGVNEDPLLVVGRYGDGRSAAFTSDCAPHWGAPVFTNWDYYDDIWTDTVQWVAGD